MADVAKTPLGHEQLTVSTSSVGLASVPTRANHALISVETQGVRWRDDGVAPTASTGMPIAAGGVLEYDGDPSALRFIRSAGADATVNAAYYES